MRAWALGEALWNSAEEGAAVTATPAGGSGEPRGNEARATGRAAAYAEWLQAGKLSPGSAGAFRCLGYFFAGFQGIIPRTGTRGAQQGDGRHAEAWWVAGERNRARKGGVGGELVRDVGRAVKCFQKAVSVNPEDQDAGEAAFHLLAGGRGAVRQRSLQVALCRGAVEGSARAFWAWRLLGLLHAEEAAWQSAVPCLQSAIKGFVRDAACWRALALCYQRLGRHSAGLKAYGRVITLGLPHVASALEALVPASVALATAPPAAESSGGARSSDVACAVFALEQSGHIELERSNYSQALELFSYAEAQRAGSATVQWGLAAARYGLACHVASFAVLLATPSPANAPSTTAPASPAPSSLLTWRRHRFRLASSALRSYAHALHLSPSPSAPPPLDSPHLSSFLSLGVPEPGGMGGGEVKGAGGQGGGRLWADLALAAAAKGRAWAELVEAGGGGEEEEVECGNAGGDGQAKAEPPCAQHVLGQLSARCGRLGQAEVFCALSHLAASTPASSEALFLLGLSASARCLPLVALHAFHSAKDLLLHQEAPAERVWQACVQVAMALTAARRFSEAVVEFNSAHSLRDRSKWPLRPLLALSLALHHCSLHDDALAVVALATTQATHLARTPSPSPSSSSSSSSSPSSHSLLSAAAVKLHAALLASPPALPSSPTPPASLAPPLFLSPSLARDLALTRVDVSLTALAAAAASLDEGEIGRAVQQYRPVFSDPLMAPRAHALLGVALAAKGQLPRALKYLIRSLHHFPDSLLLSAGGTVEESVVRVQASTRLACSACAQGTAHGAGACLHSQAPLATPAAVPGSSSSSSGGGSFSGCGGVEGGGARESHLSGRNQLRLLARAIHTRPNDPTLRLLLLRLSLSPSSHVSPFGAPLPPPSSFSTSLLRFSHSLLSLIHTTFASPPPSPSPPSAPSPSLSLLHLSSAKAPAGTPPLVRELWVHSLLSASECAARCCSSPTSTLDRSQPPLSLASLSLSLASHAQSECLLLPDSPQSANQKAALRASAECQVARCHSLQQSATESCTQPPVTPSFPASLLPSLASASSLFSSGFSQEAEAVVAALQAQGLQGQGENRLLLMSAVQMWQAVIGAEKGELSKARSVLEGVVGSLKEAAGAGGMAGAAVQPMLDVAHMLLGSVLLSLHRVNSSDSSLPLAARRSLLSVSSPPSSLFPHLHLLLSSADSLAASRSAAPRKRAAHLQQEWAAWPADCRPARVLAAVGEALAGLDAGAGAPEKGTSEKGSGACGSVVWAALGGAASLGESGLRWRCRAQLSLCRGAVPWRTVDGTCDMVQCSAICGA
ncbi:unnamed protein product [Closterium sp. Yama58-4]|nr:unnamed protein product [Closterium sp. Yama58-4]